MTKFYIDPCNIEMLLHQNEAEYITGYEGCLQDNALYETKNGYMAVYEHYLNCWQSNLMVVFSRVRNEIDLIVDEFIQNMEAYIDDDN